MAELEAMSKEEVVALLKRNSTGFSRYHLHFLIFKQSPQLPVKM